MIIGYVSPTNPFTDRRAWSGLTFKVRESIERAGYKVVWIPFKTTSNRMRFWNLLLKIYCRVFAKGKRFLLGENYPATAQIMANSIEINRDYLSCDCLFFPGNAQIAPFLKVKKPYIYYSGATVPIMLDYYWFDICKKSRKIATDIDKKASKNALFNLKASKWAANSLVKDFGCSPKNTYVIEYGPAIDTNDIVKVKPYKDGVLNIFFSGVDWERKNGDIAVETVKILREKGIDAHLFIAGIRNLPEYCKSLDYITYVGFLSKNNPVEYQKYLEIYSNCHILLVPTKAECAGVVFCEASAYGMPSYTFDTGGTTNYVRNGINGYAIPLSCGAKEFANQIFNDVTNGKLADLHKGALRLNKDVLSWEAWSNRFKIIMEEQNLK